MSDEQRPPDTGPRGPAVSRRGIMRFAGGAALAGAAAGALAVRPIGPGPASHPGPGAVDVAGALDGPAIRLVSNSADLVVNDGSPHWWNSPDIWVVPGSDPNGAPGSPVAGDQAYVWARVNNSGTDDAVGVKVTFHWANPSVQMLYSTITLIGSAFADIPAGDTQDVLCLVPWNVVTVNGGHECLVVTATLPDEAPLPDVVDPVGYPNVAQRNLTVVSALKKGDFQLTVTANAPAREDKKVQIAWALGGELPKETLASLGLRQTRPNRKQVVDVRLSGERDGKGTSTLDLGIPAGKSLPFYVTVQGVGSLAADEYQVVEIVERQQDQILGGVSFVVVGE